MCQVIFMRDHPQQAAASFIIAICGFVRAELLRFVIESNHTRCG